MISVFSKFIVFMFLASHKKSICCCCAETQLRSCSWDGGADFEKEDSDE